MANFPIANRVILTYNGYKIDISQGVIDMELYKEIPAHALACGEINITFSGQEPDISRIVEGECFWITYSEKE